MCVYWFIQSLNKIRQKCAETHNYEILQLPDAAVTLVNVSRLLKVG